MMVQAQQGVQSTAVEQSKALVHGMSVELSGEGLAPTEVINMQSNDLFNRLIDAFMVKDLNSVMSLFADDAVLIDPHYPQPRMQGRAAIERGLRWGLNSLDKPGFALRHSAIDGDIGFFEVDTCEKWIDRLPIAPHRGRH
jgi:SnoaL-like domain